MRGLGNVVRSLTQMRNALDCAEANADHRLKVLTGFGTNPGELDCRVYEPERPPRALVVVLHGCTQSASVYDRGSGWSALAERHGFAVLYPQQRRANNPNLCFNWYVPADARRGHGEAASISQMVQHVAGKHGLDRSQIFVTGLSAGGAMTAVMLATYPEQFAGGAIIAGLPFAAADTLPDALACMRGQRIPRREELAARAKAGAPFAGCPPTLSVWHGMNDNIVDSANCTAIVNQWRDLHGVGGAPGRVESIAGHRREVWSDNQGHSRVERYDIKGMGHGVPLNTRDSEACGSVGPHMLEANLCSTRQIAASWRLTSHVANQRPSDAAERTVEPIAPRPITGQALNRTNVSAIIEDALRSAGLMR